MRRIMAGKVYDTEKATQLASFNNDKMPGDYKYQCESLYLSPNGQFFLHNEGEGYMRIMSTQEVLEWVDVNNIKPDKILKHIKLEDG